MKVRRHEVTNTDSGIICTHGPMGRSPEDLELYMRLVADSKPWIKDPLCVLKRAMLIVASTSSPGANSRQ